MSAMRERDCLLIPLRCCLRGRGLPVKYLQAKSAARLLLRLTLEHENSALKPEDLIQLGDVVRILILKPESSAFSHIRTGRLPMGT